MESHFYCKFPILPTMPHIAGEYGCRLLQSTSHDLLARVSSLDIAIQLRAIVAARDSQQEVASNVLTLPFMPTFHVTTSDVQLSDVIPEATLRITAVRKIQEGLKVELEF